MYFEFIPSKITKVRVNVGPIPPYFRKNTASWKFRQGSPAYPYGNRRMKLKLNIQQLWDDIVSGKPKYVGKNLVPPPVSPQHGSHGHILHLKKASKTPSSATNRRGHGKTFLQTKSLGITYKDSASAVQ
jgi:hypothetical protein